MFAFQVARASVKVEALVDSNEIGMGDTLTLSVSVQSSDSVETAEPRVPHLNGFELMNTWESTSTSTRLMQGPGGMQFETVRRHDFNYMLAPQRTGTLTIPGFEVAVDGKTYTTKPIVIKVSAQGGGRGRPRGAPGPDDLDEAEDMFNQLLRRRGLVPPGQMPDQEPPPPSRNLPQNTNEAFFIHAEVDKTDVYEGEQIVVNWYIYTRGNLMSLDRLKFPDLKGFWKEIIEEVPALSFTPEVVNGVPFRRALLASHALFPIKTGVAIIDEYKIKAQVQLPTSPFGAFGFGKPYTYQRSSERIKINVKPLPTAGKPDSFSGAVGQFEVYAQVEGNQFPVNQPFSLKVRFEGSGNGKLIELPNLNLPSTVEVYDTKSDSKYFKNGKSYKEFEVLLIPRKEGALTIPAMSFSMFDPIKEKYVTQTTQEIPIQIVANPNGSAPGTAASGGLGAGSSSPETETKAEKKKTLPDIATTFESSTLLTAQTQTWAWSAIYLLIFATLGWKAQRDLGWGRKRRDLRAELRRKFKKIHSTIDQGEWRKAGSELANSIYHILGEVTGQRGSSQEISKVLDQAPPSLRREVGDELRRLIEITQILSFAPESVVGPLKEKSQLKKTAHDTEDLLVRALKLAENKTDE